MSIFQMYAENATDPAEYYSDNEIECLICGEEFDADEQNFPGEDEICDQHTRAAVDEYWRVQDDPDEDGDDE